MMSEFVVSRKVNADILSKEELLNLFEPNNDIRINSDGINRFCSYDRVADPNETYYLVAERGVGKTHILRLLEEQLKSHNHIVLVFGYNDESGIFTNFKRLQEKYPDEDKSDVWMLAILEEAVIKLFDEYIDKSFLPSITYKMIALTITKNLLSRYEAFFDYLKDYRSETWKRISKKLKVRKSNFWRYFPKIKVSLPIIANVSFEFDPLLFVEPVQNEKIETEIGTRINFLSSSIWATLDSRRKTLPYTYKEKNDHFTRKLPAYQSVFIIGDGLDQGENPLSHNEMIGLVSAVNLLNQKAIKHLGEKPNFKAIMAIRSVTYDYVVEPQYSELEHIRPHVEKLSWSRESLKRLMARRILGISSNRNLRDIEVEAVLQKQFPDSVHYFGKDFKSSVDFIFEITGLRPRQVLLYWENCANQTDYRATPFKAVLTADHLTKGLKIYAQEVSKDIAKEYDLEYKGLFDLLGYLASRSPTIYRTSTRKNLTNKITDYLKYIESNVNTPEWLQKSPLHILNVLYRVGIVGLPVYANKRDKKADWVETWYASDDPYKLVNSYESLVIHPSFWNWITDVHVELMLRRRYSFALYDSLSNSIQDLKITLENIMSAKPSDRDEHEEHIGRFLILSKLAREYNGYPETLDANLAKTIIDRTNLSLQFFVETIFCPAVQAESRKFKADEMADFYTKTMMEYIPSFRRTKIKFYNTETFIQKKADLASEYSKIVSPWLSGHPSSPAEYNSIKLFYDSLVLGNEGLARAVENAMDKLRELL